MLHDLVDDWRKRDLDLLTREAVDEVGHADLEARDETVDVGLVFEHAHAILEPPQDAEVVATLGRQVLGQLPLLQVLQQRQGGGVNFEDALGLVQAEVDELGGERVRHVVLQIHDLARENMETRR